jgi:hypothetical protein
VSGLVLVVVVGDDGEEDEVAAFQRRSILGDTTASVSEKNKFKIFKEKSRILD